MSLRLKLVIATSALVAAALIATGAITIAMTRAEMIDRVDATLADAMRRPPPPPTESGQLPQQPLDPQRGSADGPSKLALAVVVLAPDGSVAAGAPSGFIGDPDPLPDVSAAEPDELGSARPFTLRSADGSLEYRAQAIRLRDGRMLVIAVPLTDVEATTGRLLAAWIFTSVAVLVLLGSAAWLIVGKGLSPVSKMARTADEIAAGEITAPDMARRIDHADPATEVGRLGIALNTMLSRIESAFADRDMTEEKLRRFVADASHELRTPTAAIRGYAELYRSGASADAKSVQHAMERIEAESIRMGDLIENLLLLARLDQGRPLRNDGVDFGQVARDAVADARALAAVRPITIDTPSSGAAVVRGDEARLRQVAANLVNNALVHTDPDTPVHVAVTVAEDAVELVVEDEGGGIPEAESARIFDRFARLESSRSRQTGGAGLGLSIVKSIVIAHHGTVAAGRSAAGGARFVVAIPRVRQPGDPAGTLAQEPATRH